MTHILVRAECRENEKRVGITPLEAEHLQKKGIKVSIEDSNSRIIPSSKYRDVGCEIIEEKKLAKRTLGNNHIWFKGATR